MTAQQAFYAAFPADLGAGLAAQTQVVNLITYNSPGVTPPGFPAGDVTPGPALYAEVRLTVATPPLFVGHPTATVPIYGVVAAAGFNQPPQLWGG
ncbi:MAG: hypothetical protein M0031_09970 [Thermaerobacter sp.]|nr:hypothetical protein [Thermaerobacter sp.]